jgi:hypothetical protein
VGTALLFEVDVAERKHTRHDRDLGWVNVPGLRVAEAYGPGTQLTIDRRGFRGLSEIEARIPAGRVRIVCLGDSFTLGYGVGDAETFPMRLSARDPRLEAVNMGQGGYGPDQDYLWYRRDARDLAHDALVFLVIPTLVDRMRRDRFLDYPKPLLGLSPEGRLVVRNTPVPRPATLARLRRRGRELAELRTVQVLSGLLPEDAKAGSTESAFAMGEEEARRVFEALLVSLRDDAERADREILLVLLPSWFECGIGRAAPWRDVALSLASTHGLRVLDLVPELLSRTLAELGPLYLDEPMHHMSAKGNDWLAGRVWDDLSARPRIQARLAGAR